MGFYRFQDILLDVRPDGYELRADLDSLWSSLSWVRTTPPANDPCVRISICVNEPGGITVPPEARKTVSAEGWSVFENQNEFFLSDGSSTFLLQPETGSGTAYLSPAFTTKNAVQQRRFWSFGLLKLLRAKGYFSLHAAGLISPQGQSIVVSGPPGAGKSTLVLGLVEAGWKYLSDDALLLRAYSSSVIAFGLRRDVYIDADAAPGYSRMTLGEAAADSAGRMRRRVISVGQVGNRVSRCRPDLLLFTRIVPAETSNLTGISNVKAMKRLLEASGPQLMDRFSMGRHLDVLNMLLKQTRSYELSAGLDLYRNPEKLTHLIPQEREPS